MGFSAEHELDKNTSRRDGSSDYLDGGAGNDTLYSTSSDPADAAAGDVLAGGAGDDLLYGWTGLTTFFGGDGADTYWLTGPAFRQQPASVNWIMDFEPRFDKFGGVQIPEGETLASIATQVGDHLRLDFEDDGFGRTDVVVWLAWTRLADIEGFDVLGG